MRCYTVECSRAQLYKRTNTQTDGGGGQGEENESEEVFENMHLYFTAFYHGAV